MIKAVLLDFDGTVVYKDILDVICEINGKGEESRKINKDFHVGKITGLTPLIRRINFLQGTTISQIQSKLDKKSYLGKGARELINYLNKNKIVSILNSGNIIPVLSYYQKLLGITYIVGTSPQMNGYKILGISEKDFPGEDFKVIGAREILEKLSIYKKETIAIGDSPADKGLFALAGYKIAINPKNGIEKYADYVIYDDLSKAIPIIRARR